MLVVEGTFSGRELGYLAAPGGAAAADSCRDLSVVRLMVERVSLRPFFDPTQSPRGVFLGDVCELVYDITPVPENLVGWLQLMRTQLTDELRQVGLVQSPRITSPPAAPARVEHDPASNQIVCTVSVPATVSVERLAEIDDAVFNALSNTAAVVSTGEYELENKLVRIRQRRHEYWPEERYR